MTAPSLRLDRRPQQTMTPQLQHAVRMLQLSSLDFAQQVHAALDKNPFLEADDTDASTETGELPSEPAEADAANDVWGLSVSIDRRPGASGSDVRELDFIAAKVGLREFLHRQLNVLPLMPRDRVLAAAVVESLDDDGYLRAALCEVGALTGLSPSECELSTALKRVQALDPEGIGARSLAEYLLLQIPGIEDPAVRALCERIITNCLDRLAHHDFAGLAKVLSVPVEEVERACERIRHLDPRPGMRHGPTDVQYVTPDIVVRRVRGSWHAALNPSIMPRVKLNQTYARLFQQHRDARHGELAASLQEARWTVRNVRQRFSTILKVAQAVVRHQHRFLEYGPLAMKPLGLKEIADEVGLHESTVSRVANNKYIATPCGVFELKYFFSRAMVTASGHTCSATAIRGVIKEMIEAESPSRPLSDPEIARRLMRQGLNVARRTVTKYRQLLRLAPVERRRRHA